MKISPIALLPAVAAGLTVAAVSGIAFASPAPSGHAPHAARPPARHVRDARVSPHRAPVWVTVRKGETLESIIGTWRSGTADRTMPVWIRRQRQNKSRRSKT